MHHSSPVLLTAMVVHTHCKVVRNLLLTRDIQEAESVKNFDLFAKFSNQGGYKCKSVAYILLYISFLVFYVLLSMSSTISLCTCLQFPFLRKDNAKQSILLWWELRCHKINKQWTHENSSRNLIANRELVKIPKSPAKLIFFFPLA